MWKTDYLVDWLIRHGESGGCLEKGLIGVEKIGDRTFNS